MNQRKAKYLIPLSTCLTQLHSPKIIFTTGDLNPSFDIRLMTARRSAPSPLATALQSSLGSEKEEAIVKGLDLQRKCDFENSDSHTNFLPLGQGEAAVSQQD